MVALHGGLAWWPCTVALQGGPASWPCKVACSVAPLCYSFHSFTHQGFNFLIVVHMCVYFAYIRVL